MTPKEAQLRQRYIEAWRSGDMADIGVAFDAMAEGLGDDEAERIADELAEQLELG